MVRAADMSVDELARRCVEQSEAYRQQGTSDAQFCFELLRRALAEGKPDALTHFYRIYERQALAWVYQHSGFAETGESAEFFARAALSSFYFALRGDRFQHFPSLAFVLSYLRTCVHTTISQHLRDQRRRPAISLDEARALSYGANFEGALAADELWSYICTLLSDPADQLLARSAFLLDLKPRQIVGLYPQRWQSEREVTLDLYRIRRRLRADAELRRRFGGEEEDQGSTGSA